MESTRSDDRLAGVARFSVRHRYGVLAGAVVILIVSVVGISRIEIGTDIAKYFPQEHRLRSAFDVFTDRLGGARRVHIMVASA